MWRILKLKVCFIWLYLFGQTTYIPTRRSVSKLLMILSILPKFISAIVFIANAILYYGIRFGEKPFDFNNVSIYVISIINILSNFSSLLLNIFNPLLSRTICEMYVVIVQYIEINLKLKISFEKFSKQFHRQLISIFAYQCSTAALRFNSYSMYSSPLASATYGITFIYKDFAMLHIKLFVDLMQFILVMVNRNIDKIVRERNRNLTIIEIVNHIKWIHLCLCDISKMLNSSFGLIIIMCLLENFATTVFSVYSVFLYTDTLEKVQALSFIRT